MAEYHLLNTKTDATITDSTTVAQYFEKEHKQVMYSIRKILNATHEIGRILNCFELSSYVDSRNRTQPRYNITYTGLLLLVMGFTGTKALQLKLDYIEENKAALFVKRLHSISERIENDS